MRLISTTTALVVLLAAGSPALAAEGSAQATQASNQGRVILDCQVDKERYLKDCNVVKEDPAGQGLGVAALNVSTTLRMKPGTAVRDANGKPVRIKVPVRFDMTDRG